jgi:hypothetical protein
LVAGPNPAGPIYIHHASVDKQCVILLILLASSLHEIGIVKTVVQIALPIGALGVGTAKKRTL